MTVRRGMADYRQAGAGGILFWYLMLAGSQEMTYEQRKILYRAAYDIESVKVEVAKEKLERNKENHTIVKESLDFIEARLDQADKDYVSSYEGHQTHDEMENKYTQLLGLILKHLWIVAVRAELIENVIAVQDEV